MATSPSKKVFVGAAALVLIVAGASALVLSRMNQVIEEEKTTIAEEAPERLPAGTLFIGDKFPDLTLQDSDGKPVRILDFVDGKHHVVVNFYHPDCPCAENCSTLISSMYDEGYKEDTVVLGVLSTDHDSPRVMKALDEQVNNGIVTFPVYMDRDQSALKTLGVTRTPTVFVLDKDGTIAFWGAPESSLFPGSEGHRFFLKEAIDALRAGLVPEVQSDEPIGCLIQGV